jgi:hypothetical protein
MENHAQKAIRVKCTVAQFELGGPLIQPHCSTQPPKSLLISTTRRVGAQRKVDANDPRYPLFVGKGDVSAVDDKS